MKDGRCYECSFVFDVFVIQYLRVLFRKRKRSFSVIYVRHKITHKRVSFTDQVSVVWFRQIFCLNVGFTDIEKRIISGIEGHSFNFKRNTVLVADLIA